MFSKRSSWNFYPNRLSIILQKKKNENEKIIDLTESNPTKCDFIYPMQEILSALSNASILTYKPEPRGLFDSRKTISDYYHKLGRKVLPNQILLTASTSEAYSYLFKLLCDPDDEILVPTPSYPLFDYLCQLNCVRPKQYQLIYNGEWHIDLESLETAIARRSKAIILVHPNNPTGSFIKQNEFEFIYTTAIRNNCAIIVDEVFEYYRIDKSIDCANLSLTFPSTSIFYLNGISKLLGLPQLKLSWIVINAKPEDEKGINNRLDFIADTFLSVNTPVQLALPKLFECTKNIKEQILTRIFTNHRIIKTIFENSCVSILNSEGGWYAILRLPQKFSDEDWACNILNYLNILVYPGHFFDIKQSSYIIISLLPPSDVFEKALISLKDFIERNKT